jgi:hypothetical protein
VRKRTNALADVVAAAFGQVDAFLEAVGELNGMQRAQVLVRGQDRLGRSVTKPRDRDEIPAPGSWELYGEVEQLEQLMTVFKALRVPGRLDLIAHARALKAAEPKLPPGYER